MKNLFFTMLKTKNYAINFVTHRGAQEHIEPGQSKEMPLYDEPMEDSEIIKYYDVRYKSLGLDTKILENGASVDDRPLNAIEQAIKNEYPEQKGSIVKPIIKEESKVEDVKETSEEIVSEGPIDFTEELEIPKDDVTEWDMNKLRSFVKENNIEVQGKSKGDFVTAVQNFLSNRE